MRRARQHMTLALALSSLLLFGNTRALAGVRGAVRGPGVVRQRTVVFRAAFGGPFYWDPFWYPYPGFGWGISYAYGPPFYGGYAQLPPRNAADVAWSEFNHHWAGLFVLAIGVAAVLNRAGVGWAKHWPLLFLGLAGFHRMQHRRGLLARRLLNHPGVK